MHVPKMRELDVERTHDCNNQFNFVIIAKLDTKE